MAIIMMMTTTTTTTGTIITSIPMADAAGLYDLMSWMSPSWPIGGFAHSGGLEWAVEAGLVTDRASTLQWIADLIDHGAVHNDAVLFVHGWRAAAADDAERLATVAELGTASQTGHERLVEATAQGAAFRRIALAAAGEERFGPLLASVKDHGLPYPIAAAVLFAARGIGLEAGLTGWLHGVAANFVSASQRLVPLGQTDGQLVLRDLRPIILAAVGRAMALPEDGDPFDALGGCALVADLGCMAHETQYTRLFRT
ncbi:MAG: urease accessory UreF family protein [Sphingobium sp.]